MSQDDLSETIVLDHFDGIYESNRLKSKGSKMVQNFRIRNDGTLEKRFGYDSIHRFTDPIRGFWLGSIENQFFFLIVSGNKIYKYTESTSEITLLQQLTTSTGKINFVLYDDTLYFFDGTGAMRFIPSSLIFVEVFGYVPLYGKNFHPTTLGTVLERPNLLQPKLRVHYMNTIGATTIRLPFPGKSIDRMLINGSVVTNYSFIPNTTTFTIPAELANGTIEIGYTLSETFNHRNDTLTYSKPVIMQNPDQQRLFLYGGSRAYQVYYSETVGNDSCLAGKSFYSQSDSLYIPDQNVLALGDAVHPIVSLCPERDRLIAASNMETWGIGFSGVDPNEVEYYSIHGGVGCVGDMIRFKNGVASVAMDGIYYTVQNGQYKNDSVATCLSKEITTQFSGVDMSNLKLFWKEATNELWVSYASKAPYTVWIYNTLNDLWYTFTSFSASAFFRTSSKYGFFNMYNQLVLDNTGCYDNGSIFETCYESNSLPFKNMTDPFRTVHVTLDATFTGNLTLSLETDRGVTDFTLTSSGSNVFNSITRKVHLGRFRFLKVKIRQLTSTPCKIHCITVTATH